MSPNVGNFVHDLVEMAKAMETLPQVQAENERLNRELNTALDHNAGLEQNIAGYKSRIDELLAKVRATEAERDDAELRFLELDEKSDKAVKFILTVMSEANKAVTTLNPPKPQPEPEPVQPPVSEAVHSIEPQLQGQGEDRPTSSPAPTETGATSTTEHALASSEPANQGSSVANPTVLSDIGKSQTVISGETQTPVASGAQTTDDALQTEPKLSGPYTGKLYYNHPVHVSLNDWIDGGGTDKDWYWRPVSDNTF